MSGHEIQFCDMWLTGLLWMVYSCVLCHLPFPCSSCSELETWFWSWKWLLTAWGHRPHFKVPREEQKQTLGTLETPWSQSSYKKVLMLSFVILRRQATHFNSGNSICWSAKHAEQLCSLKPTWLSGWMDTTHPHLHKSPWWENWQRKSCIFPNKVRIMFSISEGVRG